MSTDFVKFEGTLTVRHIASKNGGFAIGDLATAIGKFKVKDTILDQFDEGVYRGQFLVTRIYPDTYSWNGRVVTEVRANVAEIFLDEADEKPVPPVQSEPDPALQTPAPVQAPAQTPLAPESEVAVPPQADVEPGAGSGADAGETQAQPEVGNPDDPDAVLFGGLYALVLGKQSIKLDPTIDRSVFRQQRDRLKVIGYHFQSASQSWEPKS